MSSESTEKVDSTATNADQSTDHKARKTINEDGHRPVDPSELQIKKILDIDGKRPVTSSNTEIAKTIQVDGNRPVDSGAPEQTKMTTDYMD